ncbi:MAG: IS110 family transposase [Actinobacteria bacterium]|nr:IS110 family transposase [Actinomycetota bacterium]
MQWTVAVGVDTHKDAHVAVARDRFGAQLGVCELASSSVGYQQLLDWASALGEPAFAIEGAGSYGAGLARFLAATGVAVYECERPRRRDRRGKSDLIDAALAATRLLSGEGLSQLRSLGEQDDLRLLLLERRGVVQARTAALNQLQAALLVASQPVQERLHGLNGERIAAACLRLRDRAGANAVLRRLARRVRMLELELGQIDGELAPLVEDRAPQLLDECGVGPVCAAQLIVSSGDPARMHSEASFAALAGTSPVDASSGRQQRHRLNRGGDRQLNRALHIIALTRVRHHPETAAYHARLLTSGKTRREAHRCVKRALARHFYHRLRTLPNLTT